MPSYIRTRSEFTVNSFSAENQTAPAVTTFADGGFLVTWVTTDPTQDGDENAIKAQLFDSAGYKVGAEFRINSIGAGTQFTPAIDVLQDGRFVASWVSYYRGTGENAGTATSEIKAQMFDRNGSAIGAEFRVDVADNDPMGVSDPKVVSLADGKFLISWDNYGDVLAQMFDSAGVRVGGIFNLNTNFAHGYGDVIALANGGFVATWRTTGYDWDVKAQIFNASGGKVGGEFLVHGSTPAADQNTPGAAALAGGGFVITWIDYGLYGEERVKAQIYTASGQKVGGELQVSTLIPDFLSSTSVTALPDGGFIVAYDGGFLIPGGGSDSEIRAQRFDASGAKVDGEFQINTLTTGYQWLPDLDTLADGRVIAVWSSGSGDGSGGSVRAQILGTELAPPPPNSAPTIISNGGGSSAVLALDEGLTAVVTVVASDDSDPTNLSYSITGGADAALFTINALNGALAFRAAPEHVDGGDNSYDVTVTVSDGQLTDSQALQIELQHVNYVTIISYGGYDSAYLYVTENQTAVTVVEAVDDDGLPLTYSIVPGYDSSYFTIDSQTGELSFTVAPDYESLEGRGRDNLYYVQVSVTDGTRSDSQTLLVEVQDDPTDDPGFFITSDGGEDYAELRVPENGTAVTVVTVAGAAGPVTYEIVGGSDASWFEIDPETGALSFVGPPDFERGKSERYDYYYGPDNSYYLVVGVTDGVSYDEQEIVVHVEDADEAPIFASYGGEAHVSLDVPENVDMDFYVQARDPDQYSHVEFVLEGADAHLFQFDYYEGLSFRGPIDYEARADSDGDNVYEVSVVAYSGALSASQSFSITVHDDWEPVEITSNGGGSGATVLVPENGISVTTVTASGDGEIYYEIVGGTDASWFNLDPRTGELSFIWAPDYESSPKETRHEAPGHGTSYSVIVGAFNGTSEDRQVLSIKVQNVDEAPRITSYGQQSAVALTLKESVVAAATVRASDPERNPVAYAIAGGADSALFAIDPSTGVLRFKQGPDFEAPADFDGDNVYEVTVAANSTVFSDTQSFSITIADVDEDVFITSNEGGDSAAVSVAENGTAVTIVVAHSGLAVTYSILGGADAASFVIDAATGALAFAAAPDFESAADYDQDNVYEVIVGASNAVNFDEQQVLVEIANVNEGVAITSRDGAESIAVELAENGTAVTDVFADDVDGDPVVYSIAGGADSHLFAIDAGTGALSFLDSANFEAPGDSDGDNVYDVVVSAGDGTFTDSQSVSVTVGDVDEAVELVSYGGAAMVALTSAENSLATGVVVGARDEDGSEVTYSITGGADSESFRIDPLTGVLSFVGPNAPDFEDPTDFDGDNVHEVTVTASSSTSSATQTLMISIANGNDAPWIGGGRDLSVDEGSREIGTIVASDVDGDVPNFAIVGGADAALFEIDAATGLLTFIAARDYETPLSAAGTNVYTVEIEAGDGEDSSRETFQVTVNDINEAVRITSGGGGEAAAFTVDENAVAVATVAATDLDGDTVTYSIAGGADSSRFTIDATTGVLSFVQAPDFDSPADSGADNVYDVVVSATDGAFSDTQSISVTVGNVDEPVELVSYGGAAVVALDLMEDSFAVGIVEARDGDGAPVTYSITGGADAHSFQIDSVTGALSFIEPNAPDFEDPTDFDSDNVHEVVVTASSATSSATQTLMISITNRNESPSLYEGPALSVNEGQVEVTVVEAYDRDGDALAYAIVGGPDAALFTLDPVTGVLKFIEARDYEAPLSAAGTNVYTLEIEAGDGEYVSRRSFEVTIRNVNEGVSITSGQGSDSLAVTMLENASEVTGIAASDLDGDAVTYSIAGGADSSRFTIDPRTGALRFVQAPDHEAPADSNGDNVYDVIVSASDGTFTDSQSVAVTVGNRNEAVVITSNGGGAGASVAVSENGTAVAIVTAGDPDGGTLTFAIAGGADAERFRIDSATGALAFVSAPNFEAPADAGANNVYDVVVSASDGSFTATQAIAVTVGNVNEGVAITSDGGGSGASVSVSENGTAVTKVAAVDLDGTAVTYAIAGGSDSARFTIDPTTGALAFVSAPDFEAPGDSGGNNVYDVLVSASDGSFTDTQAIAVRVTNVNEAPVIVSNGAGAAGAVSIAENSAAVAVVAATDPDRTALTYSIVGGADAARFTINAQTGALQFVVAPDWELPDDFNRDNVYSVIVRSSDGQLFDEQALDVTVTNIRDGNTVGGTSGGDSISATSSNIALRTSNEEDLVFGRDGHDTIQGMAGADEIYGEAGNDTLVGGEGADKLAGGFGKDQFTYNMVSESTAEARDLITDFSRSQGDKISLAAIDANSLASNNQAFTFIGTSAFSNVAGQLRYETAAGITTIFGDVDGDGIADLQIQLSGSIPLVASDFVL